MIKKHTTLKKFLLTLFFLIFTLLHCQQALRATGGTGLYKNDIWWLNFSGISDLGPGGTTSLTRTFVVDKVTITVTIDQILFTGGVESGFTLSDARLQGKIPGNPWPGDGFDEVYNINGTGSSNTLTNALSTNLRGGGSTNPLIVNFRISTYATIGGQPLDLGLVFASAEDDTATEYTQGTTNGTAWKLIENNISSITGFRLINYSNSNLTALMRMGSNGGTGTTPANVALLYSIKENTSSTAPLITTMQTAGDGRSAIALGIIFEEDFGDAPVSYGTASNAFIPVVNGGNNNPPNGGGNAYLSSGTNGGTTVITSGTFADPQDIRLGALGGDGNELVYPATGNGTSDNSSGIADEDAFTVSPNISNTYASTFSINIPAYKNFSPANTPAYILAWYDIDKNGIFEPAEYVTTSFTTNNSLINVPLTWSLNGLPKSYGSSYARFRITTTNPSTLIDNPKTAVDERSFVTLSHGETEDYSITLTPDLCNSQNPLFVDSDGDSYGNVCDIDIDNDGISNTTENISIEKISSGNGFGAGPYRLGGISGNPAENQTANGGNPISFNCGPSAEGTSVVKVDLAPIYPSPVSGASPSVFYISAGGVRYFQMTTIGGDTTNGTCVTIPPTNYSAINGASATFSNSFTKCQSTTPNYTTLTLNLPVNVSSGNLVFGFESGGGDDLYYRNLSVRTCQDFDNDNIPDKLDLDSDGDGCIDAIEGGADVLLSQLVTSSGTVSTGNIAVANQNLCGSPTPSSCVNTSGLPQFSTLPTNYNNTTGQSIGTSVNSNALTGNACKCYKAPASGTGEPTNHGITALGRAGNDGDNNTSNDWPMIRKGAWTVLESKSKGFVINRIPTTTAVNNIQNPVNGMIVYDEEADCLKIYSGTSWKCFDIQTCPDVH